MIDTRIKVVFTGVPVGVTVDVQLQLEPLFPGHDKQSISNEVNGAVVIDGKVTGVEGGDVGFIQVDAWRPALYITPNEQESKTLELMKSISDETAVPGIMSLDGYKAISFGDAVDQAKSKPASRRKKQNTVSPLRRK